jgi:hypothetical protein
VAVSGQHLHGGFRHGGHGAADASRLEVHRLTGRRRRACSALLKHLSLDSQPAKLQTGSHGIDGRSSAYLLTFYGQGVLSPCRSRCSRAILAGGRTFGQRLRILSRPFVHPVLFAGAGLSSLTPCIYICTPSTLLLAYLPLMTQRPSDMWTFLHQKKHACSCAGAVWSTILQCACERSMRLWLIHPVCLKIMHRMRRSKKLNLTC